MLNDVLIVVGGLIALAVAVVIVARSRSGAAETCARPDACLTGQVPTTIKEQEKW
jgi:hypothetical protein